MRAARTVHAGRQRQARLEARIASAEEELAAFLSIAGMTHALIGAFEVILDGADIQVTRSSSLEGIIQPQLPLDPNPEPPPAQLGFEAALAPAAYQLSMNGMETGEQGNPSADASSPVS